MASGPARTAISSPPAYDRSVSRYAAIDSRFRDSLCQSRNVEIETWSRPSSVLVSHKTTICSGSSYGNGFSNTVFTTRKIAVLAPMPKVSVSTAINTKVGGRLGRGGRIGRLRERGGMVRGSGVGRTSEDV